MPRGLIRGGAYAVDFIGKGEKSSIASPAVCCYNRVMGKYELLIDDDERDLFKRLAKEHTGRPGSKILRALIRGFIKNPDFFLDKISVFLENEGAKNGNKN